MNLYYKYTLALLVATMSCNPQITAVRAADAPEILTPPPAPQPRINGARVFGVRPGNSLLYTIAATGRRPMRFSAANLPEGLQLNRESGQITGSLATRGTYRVILRAENSWGQAERELRIVVGDELLLTPLLGCNTWGGWGSKVTDDNLRAAAKAMVDTGLINHGWQYVNIDDGWQGHRGGPHNAILPNEKFPDMKALCDYIHSLGLKAGIYSTPWTTSYSGFVGGSSDDPQGAWQPPKRRRDGYRRGKYLFETNDARQWAAWGFDYAKYDWDVNSVELTRRMADALAACDRDIVLELSNSVPLDKAAEHTSLAHLSRTTGDLVDFWDRAQMPPEIRGWAEGVREVWLEHDVWAPFQRPGHWNHACNIRIGLLGGWRDKPLTPTHLTPDEQTTHISLWCLWGSPMIIGTPIERLDPFTLSLLSNDEVLEINQDPLGIQGRRAKAGGGEAVVKPLEDGSKAVGLFNPGTAPAKVSIDWSTLGLKGKHKVRDLWRQKDLGTHSGKFTAEVRPHGVILVRLTAQIGSPAEPGETNQSQDDGGGGGTIVSQNQELSAKMSEAWKTIWSRFYHPQTNQFFTTEPSRLPGVERVKRLDPNDCGYGTGMDDCPLFGGILLVAICDQYDVTHRESLKMDALSVFKGLKLCATAHGVPGFVARGVCPADGKSIYITSSRDQYTHLVHGFWRYYHSPLCGESAKQVIREILQAIADRMTRNVTPENNYDFLRADGSQDPRGICRMLHVRTHEAARLPMFYAAAWDVGRNEEHYRLYRKHLPEAIEQSLELPQLSNSEIARWIPPYAVLQMQCSLEVLHDLESEPAMKSQTKEAMLRVAEFAAEKRVFTIGKRNPNHREYGETALAQLVFGDLPLTEQQKTELAGAIGGAEYEVDPCAAYCLLGAYWKARLRGCFQP